MLVHVGEGKYVNAALVREVEPVTDELGEGDLILYFDAIHYPQLQGDQAQAFKDYLKRTAFQDTAPPPPQ
jgi:hypothetical protein